MCVQQQNRKKEKELLVSGDSLHSVENSQVFYCMKKGHIAGVLSWLTGVSQLGYLALCGAECPLQIHRWNVLMFHAYFIFIYDIMWLQRRKQRNHHWKTNFLLKLCPWCNNILLEGKKKKTKNYGKISFVICEWCSNKTTGFCEVICCQVIALIPMLRFCL